MYTTAQDLLAFTNHDCIKALQINEDVSKLEELLKVAKKRIDIYCGQDFAFENNVSKKLNGNGTGLIDLPKRLISLTSVTIMGASISIDLFEIVNEYFLSIADGVFDSGYGNVVVTGKWGYDTLNEVIPDPLPFDITYSSNKLAEDYGLKRYGVDTEDQVQAVGPFYQQTMGQWSYKQKKPLDIETRSTGNEDVDMLLSPLVIENISKVTDRSLWCIEVI